MNDLKISPELCRAQMHCKIGRDALEGKIESNFSQMEYAMFSLLHAVEEIATVMLKERVKSWNAPK